MGRVKINGHYTARSN